MLAQVRQAGACSAQVLAAMAAVPREAFVGPEQRSHAYADRALPIGYEQTISQPLMVATLVAALELAEGDLALDVGCGSGYQAAVMAACGARVVGVERIPELAEMAATRLQRLELDVEVHVGDGSQGWPSRAPFDAIAVGAGAPHVPLPLVAQLAENGRLVVPVHQEGGGEELVRVRRIGERYEQQRLGSCRFVPLIGSDGYPDTSGSGDDRG